MEKMKNRILILLGLAFIFCFPATGLAASETGRILVVYFSHTGNTKTLATYIHELAGGDIYEIVPVTPYPEDDREAHEVGKKELESGYNPPLRGGLPDLSKYDIVFVGSPNWFSTYATPVRSFLAQVDLSGKTVVPFITYKASAARYYDEVAAMCPGSEVLKGFGVKGAQVESSKNAVEKWLESVLDE